MFGALEHMSTVAEIRSGVVRNAQGLSPDTLHETKGGMQLMVAAAQKRVRMIARVFAETGVKDLFLLIHAVTRTMPTPGAKVRLEIRHGLTGEPQAVELTLPPEFMPGKAMRLKGMGKRLGSWRGDLYVRIEPE